MTNLFKISSAFNKDKELTQKAHRLLWICLAVSLVTAAIQFFGPLAARQYLDQISTANILTACAIILGSFLSVGLLQLLFLLYKYKSGVHIKASMLGTLITRILTMRYDALIAKEPTYLLDRSGECVNNLFDYYTETLPDLFRTLITLAACYAAAFLIHWPLAVIFTLVLLVQVFGYRGLNQKLGTMSVKLSKIASRKFTILSSLLGNVDFLKQLPDRSAVAKFVYDKDREEKQVEADINIYAGKVSIIFDNLLSILSNGVYVYIPVALMLGWLDLGDSVYLALVSGLFMPAAKRMVGVQLNMKALYAANDFLSQDLAPNLEEENKGMSLAGPVTDISMDINNFSIDKKLLVQNGKAHIESGNIVKVAGQTGCGKSTLMKALVGFRPVDKVTLDGQALDTLSKASIRSHILYIPQQAPIFSGTVADNITLGLTPPMSVDQLAKRLKGTVFEKYVSDAYGLSTAIVENGANLSGGDRQKISLAKVEVFDWDVLILDEATSAMDAETEDRMLGYICQKAKERRAIVFIISHSSTIDAFCSKEILIQDRHLECLPLDPCPERQPLEEM